MRIKYRKKWSLHSAGMDHLESIRAFVHVAKAGAFGKAAERLGVSPAVVSRSIQQLERRLGALLFQRTTRCVALTELGEAYLDRVEVIVEAVDHLGREVAGESQDLRDYLRIYAPLSYGLTVLAPLLTQFLRRYPGAKVQVELWESSRGGAPDNADVALLSPTTCGSGPLAQRTVARFQRVMVSSPGYAKQHHHSNDSRRQYDVAQLDGHVLTTPTGIGDGIVRSIRATNSELAKQLVLGGAGVAVFPMYMVERDIQNGLLVQLQTDLDLGYSEIAMCISRAAALRPIVQKYAAFVEHMIPAFAIRSASKPEVL
jgi:DNA-binding transcriptional LysR family regulator